MKRFALSVSCLPLLILSTSCQTLAASRWDDKIVELDSGQEISIDALAEELALQDVIILAEKHNTEKVQDAQAKVLSATVKRAGWEANFSLGWEFLNFTDQNQIARTFEDYASGEISGEQMLTALQGNTQNRTYLPILKEVAALEGELLGVNLSRADKAPVVKGGIDAAKPELIPPGFEMGGEFYFERFESAMKGHAPPEKIQNYFAAQCLTDDVVAYHLIEDSQALKAFLVVGSFHADYGYGATARFRARYPHLMTRVVKFVDASDYSEKQLKMLVSPHPKYGLVADWLYFVNEPK